MSRITIIPADTFCSIDGVGYHGVDMSTVPLSVHAVQWYSTTGWVEFVDLPDGTKPANQTISTMAPYQAVLDSWTKIDYAEKHPPQPDPVPPTAEQNSQEAQRLLSLTDWTQIPSVSDPAQSNPYLANPQEFAAYRTEVRNYVLNPVAGFVTWPQAPVESWVTTP